MSPKFNEDRRLLESELIRLLKQFEQEHEVLVVGTEIIRSNRLSVYPGAGKIINLRLDLRIP